MYVTSHDKAAACMTTVMDGDAENDAHENAGHEIAGLKSAGSETSSEA